MWKNFFVNGGFGMYPVSLFGLFLIAAAILYVMRPQQKTARLALLFGGLTFAAGLLGAVVGMCNTFHYLPQVAHADQLEVAALGCEESLHNVVLALMLVVLGGLIASVGTQRQRDAAPLAS